MRRVAIVAAIWFVLWMILCATVGAVTGGDHGDWENRLYAGIFNGAWLAVLTSFAWPWIMPAAIDHGMYGVPTPDIDNPD